MSVLFSYAFRPLFLLTTLYAIVVVPLWTAAWLGYVPLPGALGAPVAWHAHEMIYGFAGAAVGGFALTAVATWTKRPPVAGPALMSLCALWISARLLFVLPSSALRFAAIAADVGYGVLLFALMSREVIGARNRRNYKVLVLLALFAASNALFFVGLGANAGWMMAPLFAGLWVVVLLINLIAGRIVPGFTRNWLKRQVEVKQRMPSTMPPAFDRFDLFTTCLLVAFAFLHLAKAPALWTAVVGAVTGLSLFIRLWRWQGLQTGSEPLVWVLHLGFAWLPAGVLLLAAAAVGLVPETSGTHALTSGAIATMIVAVASRAALGHTSRPLTSHPLLTAAYVLVTIAAACRVAATFGLGARALLALSALTWFLGFLCFAWRYTPILVKPRLQKPGSLPVV